MIKAKNILAIISILTSFTSSAHLNLDNIEEYIDPSTGLLRIVTEADTQNLPDSLVLVTGESVNPDSYIGNSVITLDTLLKATNFGEDYNTETDTFASDANGDYLITGKEYWFYHPGHDVKLGDVRTFAKNRIIGEVGNEDRPDKYKLYIKGLEGIDGLRLEYGDRIYFVNDEGTPLWFGDYTYVNHAKDRPIQGLTMGYATIQKNPNHPEKLRLHVSSDITYYNDFGVETDKFRSSRSVTRKTFLELSYLSIFGRKTEGTFWLNAGYSVQDWKFVPAE